MDVRLERISGNYRKRIINISVLTRRLLARGGQHEDRGAEEEWRPDQLCWCRRHGAECGGGAGLSQLPLRPGSEQWEDRGVSAQRDRRRPVLLHQGKLQLDSGHVQVITGNTPSSLATFVGWSGAPLSRTEGTSRYTSRTWWLAGLGTTTSLYEVSKLVRVLEMKSPVQATPYCGTSHSQNGLWICLAKISLKRCSNTLMIHWITLILSE